MQLTEKQIRDYRDRMRNDPELLGKVVTKELTRDVSNCILHKDIYRAILERPNLMAIIAPRGHSKTSITSTIGTIFDIAFDREDVIVLIKKTFPQAVTDLKAIVDVIKFNEMFRLFFGKREFEIDRQEKVYIINPYTGHKTYIEVKGCGQPIRGVRAPDGRRPTKIVMDDFEDEKNVATPEQREKIKQYVAGQIIPAVEPSRSCIIAIGTIVHYDSWLNNLNDRYVDAMKEGRSFAWQVIFHQMIENGVPIWPERFTPEYIATLRKTYEDDFRMNDYWQEYFNIPFNVDTADFKKEYIKYWSGFVEHTEEGHVIHITHEDVEEIRPCDFVIGIDPSAGIDGNDFTGIVGLAVTSDGKRYLEMAERLMLKPNELKDKVFELNEKYHPRLFIMEEVSMQVIMGYWLRETMVQKNIFIPIKGEKAENSMRKNEKLLKSLQPVYQAEVVYHKRAQTSLEEELFTFPKQRHDDIMDGLYFAFKYTFKPDSDKVVKRVKKRVRAAYDWMTGVRRDSYDHRREDRRLVA